MTPSEVSTPVNSPQYTPSTSNHDVKKESIEESLRQPFKALDVQSVTSAYDTEFAQLSQYEAGMYSAVYLIKSRDMHAKIIDMPGDQEFNDMLLSAMLEVRAWALGRPVAEQDATGDALADRMETVKKTEEEQGRSTYLEQTRLRLLNFISSIKSALAALTTSI